MHVRSFVLNIRPRIRTCGLDRRRSRAAAAILPFSTYMNTTTRTNTNTMPSRTTLSHGSQSDKTPAWHSLPVHPSELCLATTLKCGQSFRWKHNEITNTYSCTLRGRIIQLKQEDDSLSYRAIWPSSSSSSSSSHPPKPALMTAKKRKRTVLEEPLTPPASMNASATPSPGPGPGSSPDNDDTLDLIRHYLNLAPNLSNLYTQWSTSDKNFAKKAPRFTGIRILRQDAWEALVCFICSSNNNIARIGQMVDKLCIEYGQYINEVDWPVYNVETEQEDYTNKQKFYDFPKPRDLLGAGVEGRLRELGFGYRAKYIAVTARIVCERGGETWVDSLRNPECPSFASGLKPQTPEEMTNQGREGYRAAHEALLELQGVGPKVADCVCLMGLAWGEAVPVDTHVWQIAQRDYKFGGKGKNSSLTKATYDAVGDHFRKLWGVEAGWAHSVLFTADLRAFSDRLVKVKTEKVVVKKEEETETVKRVFVKKEVLDEEDGLKAKIEIDETALTISSSERVKRRRKR